MEGEGKRHDWCNVPLKQTEINLIEKLLFSQCLICSQIKH